MLFWIFIIVIALLPGFPPTGNGSSTMRSFPPAGGGPCYYIDGTVDRVASACYPLNTVGASMCCFANEKCLAEGLCLGAPLGLVGQYDDGMAIWRRSCSDYMWQDPACLAIAPGRPPISCFQDVMYEG